MKIKGFTLAEVLIAIGIIGAIAAMTIPNFTANVHNQTNASKLSAVVSDYENIFGMMLLKEDRELMSNTNFATAASLNEAKTALGEYTKFIDVSIVPAGSRSVRNIRGGAETISYGFTITTNSGAIIYQRSFDGTANLPVKNSIIANLLNSIKNNFITSPAYAIPSTSLWRAFYIDVNGETSPNMFGRDIFAFAVGQDGVFYPFGTSDASYLMSTITGGSSTATWHSNDTEYGCNTGNYNGLGCTARLIENNYKMDY